MTVYNVIQEIAYEMSSPIGVYSSREKAEAKVQELGKAGFHSWYEIYEFELDDTPERPSGAPETKQSSS